MVNHNNDNVRYSKAKRVEMIADRLVEKLGNSEFRPFYCKVAYKLNEARIWELLESATTIKKGNPAKLFSWLCKRDGV